MSDDVKTTIAAVLDAAEASFDARAVEPPLLKLRSLLKSSSEPRWEFLDAIRALTTPGPGELPLARPGVVEILEFCMRELRWPEIREAMVAMDSPAHDWRVQRAAQRVLEVYDDEWPGGDIYDTYREP
ncbi:hypothetical protein [Sanguibacter sp. 25GB23B1]|uniref:hypothetical protein n=1 Tax=unclassified Sanguibacter TaxID=2645534 RepID=UPI0032B00C50